MTQDEIVAEFRKKYEGTYIYVQEPNSIEENLFYVRSIEPSSDKVGILNLESDNIGKIRLNFGSAHTLKFLQAPVGVFQSGPDAMFCRRKPGRQWRRGICSDNTTINTTVSQVVQNRRGEFDFNLVQDAFAGAFTSLKDAFAKLNSKKFRSVALFEGFSLSQAFVNSPDYVLFFWDLAVAKISPAGKVSLVLEPIFTKQILQLLEREGY